MRPHKHCEMALQILVGAALEKSNELSEVVGERLGAIGTPQILNELRAPVQALIADISALLRKKLSISEYDSLLGAVEQWDSFYSYHHQELNPYTLSNDKSLFAKNVAKLCGKRFIVGKVASCAMQKTVVVERERIVAHHPTGKQITRTTRIFVHDEDEICRPGDLVIAEETRPISKRKHHKLFRRIVF